MDVTSKLTYQSAVGTGEAVDASTPATRPRWSLDAMPLAARSTEPRAGQRISFANVRSQPSTLRLNVIESEPGP